MERYMKQFIRVRRGVVHGKGGIRHHDTSSKNMKVEQIASGIRHQKETNLEKLRENLEHLSLRPHARNKYVFF